MIYLLAICSRSCFLEPVLFNGTVFDNVRYGLVGTEWEFLTQEKQVSIVEEACKLANAHEFISNLPNVSVAPQRPG